MLDVPTSLRAIATYENGVTRDITHLVAWVIPESAESMLEQNSLSKHVLKAKALFADVTIAAKIQSPTAGQADITDQVTARSAAAISLSYRLIARDLRDDQPTTAIPLGIFGRLQVLMEAKDARGNLLTTSDVTEAVTFTASIENAIELQKKSIQRSGLFAGKETGDVTIAATLNSEAGALISPITLTILSPIVVSHYFQRRTVLPFFLRPILAQYSQDGYPPIMPEFVNCTSGSPAPGMDEQDSNQGVRFIGDVVQPALTQFTSDCVMRDISNEVTYEPAGILQVVPAATDDDAAKVVAIGPATNQAISAKDANGNDIATDNTWSISVQSRRLTAFVLSDGWYGDPQGQEGFEPCYAHRDSQEQDDAVAKDPNSHDGFPHVRHKRFQIWLVWNDCLVEELIPDAEQGLPEVTLTVNQGDVPLGSFGTGEDSLVFTYDMYRGFVRQDIAVTAVYDFSSRCYATDMDCTATTQGTWNSDEQQFIVEGSQPHALGIRDVVTAPCNSYMSYPEDQFHAVLNQAIALNLIISADESVLEDQGEIICAIHDAQVGETSMTITHGQEYAQLMEVDGVNYLAPITGRYQGQEMVIVTAYYQSRETGAFLQREFRFQMPDAPRNTALFEDVFGTVDGNDSSLMGGSNLFLRDARIMLVANHQQHHMVNYAGQYSPTNSYDSDYMGLHFKAQSGVGFTGHVEMHFAAGTSKVKFDVLHNPNAATNPEHFEVLQNGMVIGQFVSLVDPGNEAPVEVFPMQDGKPVGLVIRPKDSRNRATFSLYIDNLEWQ